jgi:superoxide reductase
MLKTNRYEDIAKIENEGKRDYVDRHSPFIHTEMTAKKGEAHSVTVKMGKEYAHPDDLDHYISNISLYAGEMKLVEATFLAGALGGQGAKGNQTITFNIVLSKDVTLTARSYCTKHGIWESEPVKVEVK